MEIKGIIEVPILCHSNNSSNLKELGIESNDYNVKTGCLNVDKIIGFYPNGDNSATIVEFGGDTMEVCWSYDAFKAQYLQAIK